MEPYGKKLGRDLLCDIGWRTMQNLCFGSVQDREQVATGVPAVAGGNGHYGSQSKICLDVLSLVTYIVVCTWLGHPYPLSW